MKCKILKDIDVNFQFINYYFFKIFTLKIVNDE